MRAAVAHARRIDDAILEEVLAGLLAPRKHLPCKLFYDEKGARLFEQICTLPEYYPTRTELQILRAHGAEMAKWIGSGARIVEFGSGSGEKTRVLLGMVERPSEYVPIDIAHSQMRTLAHSLEQQFPALRVQPITADYTRPLQLPATRARTIVFFPGSTIGNFEPAEAVEFLRNAAAIAGPRGGLLIGVDLRKERATLERAYNDAAGVTADFNRNILTHVNRVCAADFDSAQFEHRAFYDETFGRIEMHLVSRAQQHVTLARTRPGATRVCIAAGETILTEYSYKYSIAGFQSLARAAGFEAVAVWTDPANKFSVHAFDVA